MRTSHATVAPATMSSLLRERVAAESLVSLYPLYRHLDEQRRCQARLLDLFGFAPCEQAGRTVLSRPGMELKAYGGARNGPVVLLVPAPIKRAYLWDLMAGASVVERLLEGGICPYLIHWDEPDPDCSLADYAVGHLEAAVLAVQADSRAEAVFLAGHSLGGLFAAIFAAQHPALVRGLILLAAPMHFAYAAEAGALGPVIARFAHSDLLARLPGNLPGSALSLATCAAAPSTFGQDRRSDWLRSLANPEALATHMRVERWSLDELPLARRFLADMVHHLYARDAFLRGSLNLFGRPASARELAAPLFVVADRRCALVPPAAILPFYDAVASRDKQLAWYEGDVGVAIQHVGPLVGQSAHRHLWPGIVGWMGRHWSE